MPTVKASKSEMVVRDYKEGTTRAAPYKVPKVYSKKPSKFEPQHHYATTIIS